jgi:hypothetical protein
MLRFASESTLGAATYINFKVPLQKWGEVPSIKSAISLRNKPHGDPTSRVFSSFMNSTLRLLSALALCFSASNAFAQYEFRLTLRGTTYQTNAAGKFITSPMSESSVLKDLNVPDSSGMALVYHINGNSFGDTIDVVDVKTGAVLDTLWGFYFGSDLSLGRMALTNSAGTEMRRVDYIYNTKQSPYALGSAFLTKKFVTDKNGQVRTSVDAQVQYLVRPENGNPARFGTFNFTTTKPFVPSG